MLPRQNRLKDQADFDKIFKNGRKISTPLFLLAYINRDDQKPTRVGVVAGKKVGGAVQRNRAKRILREASKELLITYPNGYDVSLISNSKTTKSTSLEISQIVATIGL